MGATAQLLLTRIVRHTNSNKNIANGDVAVSARSQHVFNINLGSGIWTAAASTD
jgi:hypothetical protein